MLKVPKRNKPQVQWPFMALIDVVFLLLIYFLLTTNFLSEEGLALKLPQARKSIPQKEQSVIIYIDKKGNFFLHGKKVSFLTLKKELQKDLARSPKAVVIVKADRRVFLGQAVKAMDIAKAAGAQKLFLATEQP